MFIFFAILLFNSIVLSNLFWLNVQDDKWFVIEAQEFSSVWQCLITRWQGWSGRLFIDFILYNVLNLHPYIWAFLNAIFVTLIFYSISNLANIKNLLGYFILAVAIISYSILPNIGLCSVSTNYIWPLACGLFFLSILKDAFFDNKEIPLFKKIICLVLLFFSCNNELLCSFFISLVLFLIVYCHYFHTVDSSLYR